MQTNSFAEIEIEIVFCRIDKMDFKCPICGKVIPSATSLPEGKKQINAAFFPFCSERCRLVDLGAWLDGDYSISTADPTPQEDQPQ